MEFPVVLMTDPDPLYPTGSRFDPIRGIIPVYEPGDTIDWTPSGSDISDVTEAIRTQLGDRLRIVRDTTSEVDPRMSHTYDPGYFRAFSKLSHDSANVIAPLAVELVSPKSVLDVGCGLGQWLAAFRRAGAEIIRGLDGDYVQRDQLEIPLENFQAHDLTKPFPLDEHFDLTICLEVAEHLPERCARDFVQSLTATAPVVLFSAAIPHQPGREHVNCQWPEYWAHFSRSAVSSSSTPCVTNSGQPERGLVVSAEPDVLCPLRRITSLRTAAGASGRWI